MSPSYSTHSLPAKAEDHLIHLQLRGSLSAIASSAN
jgi:hypothetical protein